MLPLPSVKPCLVTGPTRPPRAVWGPDATAGEGLRKIPPAGHLPGFIIPAGVWESSFIRDKGLGPRKHTTHLVDEGADEVDEADLQLGELVRLVPVHHGLSWGRKS